MPLTATILDAASAVNSSGGIAVEGISPWAVQLIVGTCTSYTLLIQGSNNCTTFATLQTLTEANVGSGATGFGAAVTVPVRCMRALLSAVNSCTITAVLHGVP